MSEFVIGQSHFNDGKLVEVAIQCTDDPAPPEYHLFEAHLMEPSGVIDLIKEGHAVKAAWAVGSVPIEIVTLPDGTETIEVVQRGQPEGYRSLADLPDLGFSCRIKMTGEGYRAGV